MKITFYIDKSNKPLALAEYILGLEGSIYIHCNDLNHANQISQLLWSYPDRFIANQVSDTPKEHIITIGYQTVPQCHHIINVSNQSLEIAHIEWVMNDVELARSRYKQYKQLGYELTSHTL